MESVELTKISGNTHVDEYPDIQNANMDVIENKLNSHSSEIAALQATCLYVDSEGYLCLKEE